MHENEIKESESKMKENKDEEEECPATNLEKIRNQNKIIKRTGFIEHKNDPYSYMKKRLLQDNPDGYGVSLAEEAEKKKIAKMNKLKENGYGRNFY